MDKPDVPVPLISWKLGSRALTAADIKTKKRAIGLIEKKAPKVIASTMLVLAPS
jgi:hypothetical protein